MYSYEHGGNAVYYNRSVLDFSANVNPLGLPQGVKEAIGEAIADCTSYPDNYSKNLRSSIACFETVKAEHIICANGASDLIFRLAFALKPKKAMVLAPSFSDYSRALKAAGCSVCRFFLHEESGFEVQSDILEAIKNERIDLLFICNPNNPTGCVTDKVLIEKIIEQCCQMGCYVVVDECFMDFLEKSESFTVKGLIGRYPNLFVLKAFTKIFAMPGMRLGYGMTSNARLIDALYFHGSDWGVSALAQKAGIAALKSPQEYIAKTREYVGKEKEKILSQLNSLGLKTFASKANYLFFKSDLEFDLSKKLYSDYDISIRSCNNYEGLGEGFFRIGIGEEEANKKLMLAIKQIITKGGNQNG